LAHDEYVEIAIGDSFPDPPCSICTHVGSIDICLLGIPNASTVSLCTYINNVWNPKNRDTQLSVDMIECLCDIIEYIRLDVLQELDMEIPMWLMAPVNNKLDIHI
jgi:hypothetical protein